GGMCAAERHLRKARALLDASLARWTQSDRWGAVWALIELARLAIRQDDRDRAMLRVRDALILSRDLGDAWSLSAAPHGRAALASREGALERAIRLAEAAAAVRERAGIVQSPHESRWLREALAPVERSLARSSRLVAQQAGRAICKRRCWRWHLGAIAR